MNAYDRLPDAAAEIFGEDATAELTYDLLTVDVPATSWIAALETARDQLGCTYFDWLSAVDEPDTGFRVCAHVAALGGGTDGGGTGATGGSGTGGTGGTVRRLLVRTTVPHDAAVLPTAVEVYAGAGWHERETYEMFGISFTDHPNLAHLLLPEAFEGHPLRKDFVLAARVAKAWPGAKEPGESEHGGPKRRQMLPPGVPDPNEWGPLKGQLPPAPARPARGARAGGAAAAGGAARGAGAAGDRPARRARSVTEGSAAQRPAPPAQAEDGTKGGTKDGTDKAGTEAAPPTSAPTEQTPRTPEATEPKRENPPTTQDAPWHKPRPAFEDGESRPAPAESDNDGPENDGPANKSSASRSPESNGPRTDGEQTGGPRPEGRQTDSEQTEDPRPEDPRPEDPRPEDPQSNGPRTDRPGGDT
ncbi:NADH-quinone oxidoreductase subunit C [Streptomyces sp. NPDC088116]|uniref:NADH-quinone oxidoreductase subunit C n=1 Tax=Streptomyces sp. NPDC088116 TaxID=3365825 RepID=UPI003803DC6C